MIRALRWLMLGAAGAAVVGALSVTVILPLAVRGAALSVRSGSMSPALQVGDLAIDRRASAASLRVGDIATYRAASGALVTHRIVALHGTGAHRWFTFRGDANAAPDPQPVPAADVTGRVWFTVPYLGTVRERLAALRGPILIAAIVALSGYAMVQFGAVVRDRRRQA